MITKCGQCGECRSEGAPTPCPNCHPDPIPNCKPVQCGNACDRPAVVVTEPIGLTFCSACYEGFQLGQDYPKEAVKVGSEGEPCEVP